MNGACTYVCGDSRVDVDGDLEAGAEGTGCECTLSNGGVETCDGLDNDCDGLIDDFDTPPSDCEPVEGAFVTLCESGTCTYVCVEGRGDADGDLGAGAEGTGCECTLSNGGVETCDGLDNDCDGLIDDFEVLTSACAPVDGAIVASCEQGACIYACGDGRGDVNGDLETGSLGNGCECTVTSGGVEVCDRRDNDCDGLVDNGVMGSSCPFQQGVCLGSVSECTDGLDVCANAQYEAAANASGQTFEGIGVIELACDGQDNNCDGIVDENCCQTGMDPLNVALSQITNFPPDTSSHFDPIVVSGRESFLTAGLGLGLNSGLLSWGFTQNTLGTEPSIAQLFAQDTGGIPAVVWDGVGYSIASNFATMSNDESKIIWQRINTQGVNQIQPFELDIGNDSGERVSDVQIVSLGGGDFALLWLQDISTLSVRMFGFDGSPTGPARGLNAGTFPSEPRMALSSSGQGALMVWRNRSAGLLAWRKLDFNFNFTSNAGSLSVNMPSNILVTSKGSGYALAYSAEDERGVSRVHYTLLSEDGQVVQSEIIIEGGTEQTPRTLAVLDNDRVALVWTENGNLPDQESLLYVVMDEQGQMENEPRVLLEEDVRSASMAPLREPGQLSRVIGLVIALSVNDQL
ncbi:MAG: MopE-related protein [Bacteroidota bacterium]